MRRYRGMIIRQLQFIMYTLQLIPCAAKSYEYVYNYIRICMYGVHRIYVSHGGNGSRVQSGRGINPFTSHRLKIRKFHRNAQLCLVKMFWLHKNYYLWYSVQVVNLYIQHKLYNHKLYSCRRRRRLTVLMMMMVQRNTTCLTNNNNTLNSY